jgi:GT2 family glycosyltransferase
MDQLLVSFCIATRNRGEILVDCLRRVQECGLGSGEYEILVVDNGSTDGTRERAREVSGVEWIWLEKNCGPVAKNLAMRRARGEFVVVLDDDAYPMPGAVARMVEHFRSDAALAAAVFDVMLPDGTREGSAYPDVFIGAGTGLRHSFLEKTGLLPAEFFMQAEEYDLSFRLLDIGGGVRRFADMPLVHLKTPAARIGERTTRLDVRNNMYLLAKYVPAPLCYELAADWLARYWWMALGRDETQKGLPAHRKAYLAGAAEGMAKWSVRRAGGSHLLKPATIETIFKFDLLARRMAEVRHRFRLRRILFADVGKNMLGYWKAARAANLEVAGIIDRNLAAPGREYRDIAVLGEAAGLAMPVDGIIVSNLSPVGAQRRSRSLRQIARIPVIDLLETGWEGPGVL